MVQLRFSSPATIHVRTAQGVVIALLAGITGLWAIRLTTPAPTLVPIPYVPPTENLDHLEGQTVFSGKGNLQGPLALHGIIWGQVGDSVALLSLNGGPERAIRPGHELAPGIRLLEVQAGAVVLDRQGQRVILELPKQSIPSIGPTSPH